MPEIVYDPGAADANSFQSLGELDAYLSAHPYGAAALARSEADRQSALIVSARLLSTGLCYEGQATYADQALAMPRTGLTRQGGWGVSSETNPIEIKNAQAELSRLMLSSPGADPTAETEASAAGLLSIKAGSVALAFDKDRGKSYSPVPAAVRAMIPAGWICQPEKPRLAFAAY